MTSNTTSVNKWPLYSMAFGNFAVGIGSLIVAGVLQPMADDLQVSLGQIGQLITIYALAYAIGSPLLIAMTGNIDRRILLAVGLGMAVVGNAITAFAPSYGFIYAARILIALGAAIFTPVASTVAAVISPPEERGKAIALVFAGFTAATALGVPAGTYIGLSIGWRLTFALVAVTAALGVVGVFWYVPAAVKTPAVSLKVLPKPSKMLAWCWSCSLPSFK